VAQKVLDKGGDYLLGLKGNQGALRADAQLFVEEQESCEWRDVRTTFHQSVDADHGRIETRRARVLHDLGWLQQRHAWPGLRALLVIDATREAGGRIERERRFYITSSPLAADRLGPLARAHWAIENSLHWVMDMSFKDDETRVRTGQAPENFATLRHMAANLARRAPGRDSIRLKLKTAAWDDAYLANLITT
jgi:predicted transposase YbfD/YdcC